MKNEPEQSAAHDANSDAARGTSPKALSAGRRTKTVILLATVGAVLVVAMIALLLWNRGRSGAGRPGPAPRNIAADNSGSPNQT